VSWEPQVISGHPELMTPEGVVITLCAGCQRMRTILWLDNDRWHCTNCRDEGRARPTMIPIGGQTKER
jgi:hypothetical protein